MAIIGYLEGTSSIFLTQVCLAGFSTLPLGNGWDGHGKYIAHIGPQDNICVVVGYLHKLLPTPESNLKPADLLFACRTHNIPVVVIAPKEGHEAARKLLGDAANYVTLVDRDTLYETVLRIAGRGDR
ncbi:MAG: hypothetical protein ACUVXG_02610 [Anaerolineae bacterium]